MATQNTRALARWMMAPSVGLLLIWMIVPLAMTLWFSFQNYNLLNPGNVSFAGLFNYSISIRIRLFSSRSGTRWSSWSACFLSR
jgi:ABC-type sugar transport system permease subunit